ETSGHRCSLCAGNAFRNREEPGSQPVHSVMDALVPRFPDLILHPIRRKAVTTPTAEGIPSRRISPPGSSSVLLGIALLLLFATGCGKRRPPQPPIERVQQRTELLSGVQRGNQVLLSWPAPLRNAPNSSVQSIRRIDVYRLAEKPNAPLPLTEEEFAARSNLIGSVPYAEIQKAGDELTYTDTLELAGQPTRLRYAVRYVNASGQR